LLLWIDYNQDGDFDEVNEYYPFSVFSSPILGGTFTVPSTAKNGITRLRIACQRNAVPTANEYCGGYTYGEFEDYKITISGGVANTNITWSPSTFLTSAVGSTVSINNITSATTYTVTYTDAYGCTSTATETIGVHPLPQATIVSNVSSVCGSDTVILRNNSYCTPTVSSSNVSGQHFISFFIFGSNLIANNSGDGPGVYNYYATQTANVTAGSVYPITIGHGGSVSTSKAIWIDLNHDGDFSDGGELVFSASSGNALVSASLAIQPTASNGMTRMRVAVSSAPSISSGQSCAGFFWGEYEDYNLNISGGVNSSSWSPSAFLNTTTGGQVVANNLNATITYTLTVTDANGCSQTDAHTITKYTVPTVTINASTDSVCTGSNVTLSGVGASTYVWSNGVTNGVAFAPTATTTYTVTGTASNGCTKTATQTVEVLAIPTFPTNSSGDTICPGTNISLDLLPSYCTPYAPLGYYVGTIITGFQLGSFSSFHSASGADYNDYTNEVIEVNAGSTYSFNLYHASNSTFYSIFIDYNQNGIFENSELIIDDFTSLPTVSYGGITIPSTALSGKTRIRLAVSRNFIEPCKISVDPDFYDSYGQYEDYTLKISGGAQIYSWSPSTYLNTTVSNSVVANSVLSPITYTVTLTGSNGCTATKNIAVSLLNNPVVNSTASASMVCIGDSVTLTATGANQYSWSHGVTNGTPFAVNSSTTYTVIGTDTNGCQNTSTQTVNVYAKPTIPSLTSPVECIGLPTQLALNLNYCTPSVTSNLSNRDYIDTFIFNGNGIQSYTGEGPGSYNYYSNTMANVMAGNAYTFTMGIGGTVANLRAIWVDYNQDGDFTDPGEFVYSATATLNTLTSSFTIPTTASNGITRMRVLCTSSIGGSLINTSCSGVVFGEYEDYNLKISGGINSIVWAPSNLLIDTVGSKVQTVALNSNTNYGITVTDIHGCTNQGIYTALVKPSPAINLSANNNSICPGSTIALSSNTTGSVFSSTGPSLVMNGGPSSSFPAVCNVSGLTSGASVKRIYINSLTHTNPDDIDMWLESPNGQMVMLMSDVGGSYDVVNANLIIEDSNTPFPGNNWILSNTSYMPTNDTLNGPNEPLNASSQLSHFTGNLNGNWNLYVQDDNALLDSGSMVSFRIEFENDLNNISWATTNPSAQAGIANPLSLNTNAIVPANTTYTLTATDANGCTNTSSINITTDVPNASFISTAGNTLCVDNANTTLRLDSNSYCIPTHASGPDQSNYYLTSFYLPDGVTSPWFIATTQSNYTYYAHTHQLTAGNNYTCTLGYNYTNSHIHAWADYNQDGDFYDVGEYLGNVLGTSSTFGSTVNILINVPTTARNGYVRLRVAATNSSSSDPCGGNIFGEYEDYDLIISGGVNNPNIVWSPATNLSSANGISVNASSMMSSTTYTVTVSDDGGCTNTSTQTITISSCGNATQTNVKLFIQGYYSGLNTMTTALTNQGQPSTAGICDTVMIELRDKVNTNTLVASSKSLLQTNGNVSASFAAIPKGYYYIVIKHRNGLETWSASPTLITNTSTYDFSNAASKAYGNNQIEVGNGQYALFSGDINQDMAIDALDYIVLDVEIIAGASGYLTTDLNGDGYVDAFDYIILDANLVSGVGAVTP
jgi:subtilisin-like proprotein convertase family protein